MNKRKIKSLLVGSFLLTMTILTVVSCSKDDGNEPKPSIVVSPASGKAGDEITITCAHIKFSTTALENTVTFNDEAATVVSATATELKVTVPARAGDGIVSVTVGDDEILGESFDYIQSLLVSTFAGSTQGFADGQGINARFNSPHNIVTDNVGNVYVADYGNHKIRKITPAGVVTTLAGSTSGTADGQGENAQFNHPMGIAIDVTGNIYVGDFDNHKIRKITPTGVVTTLAGSVAGFADGQGSNAQFNWPKGIAVDVDGNIYVADSENHRIRKITPAGEVSTLAGGIGGFADGEGADARFAFPFGVAADAAGNLYVADEGNNRIRKITTSGEVTTLAGSTAGFTDGQGANAKFANPAGITIDAFGNIYVADNGNNKIRMITATGIVSTIAGSTSGAADGQTQNAQFNLPIGIAVNGFEIYVADKSNHRIRKIALE